MVVKRGKKQKYAEKMSEVWKMRLTAEQKRLIFEAAPPADYGGTALVWRDYNVYTAEQLLKLKAGEISVSEFSDTVSEYATKHLARVADIASGESKREDTD